MEISEFKIFSPKKSFWKRRKLAALQKKKKKPKPTNFRQSQQRTDLNSASAMHFGALLERRAQERPRSAAADVRYDELKRLIAAVSHHHTAA